MQSHVAGWSEAEDIAMPGLRSAHPKGFPLNALTDQRGNRIEYETPDEVFDHFDRLYHFYMDVCASKRNHKVRRYFTAEIDALIQDWIGTCWMNPPYVGIRQWVEKAHLESLKGATVVGLLPAWTADTWFHEFVVPYADITFLRKRLRFVGPAAEGYHATFSSIVAVWPRAAAVKSQSARQITVSVDL